MKRAIVIVAGLAMGFMTMGVAFAANIAPSDNAMSQFQGSVQLSTPVSCGGGNWITTTTTLVGTSVDNTTLFGQPDPGPFTLNSTQNGLKIKAATVVNTQTGQGYATGSFDLKEDATHRVHGSFVGVEQVLDQASGTAVGRGFVEAFAQKQVTVNGKKVWKNTKNMLLANNEFVTGNLAGGPGNVQGYLGTDFNPQNGQATVPPQVADLSVKTTTCT